MARTLIVENSTLESWRRRQEIMAIIPGCMRYLAGIKTMGACSTCGDTTADAYMNAKKCIVLLGDTKKRELMAALRVQSVQLSVPISGKVKTLVFNLPK